MGEEWCAATIWGGLALTEARAAAQPMGAAYGCVRPAENAARAGGLAELDAAAAAPPPLAAAATTGVPLLRAGFTARHHAVVEGNVDA